MKNSFSNLIEKNENLPKNIQKERKMGRTKRIIAVNSVILEFTTKSIGTVTKNQYPMGPQKSKKNIL